MHEIDFIAQVQCFCRNNAILEKRNEKAEQNGLLNQREHLLICSSFQRVKGEELCAFVGKAIKPNRETMYFLSYGARQEAEAERKLSTEEGTWKEETQTAKGMGRYNAIPNTTNQSAPFEKRNYSDGVPPR